jgi:peroxiredoxin
MFMKRFLMLSLIISCHFTVFAQVIKGFTLPNTSDGTSFSLSNHSRDKAIILIFFSGKCAYTEHYIERIKSINSEYLDKGVRLILINSNNSDFVTEESTEEMKSFSVRNKLTIPYLADKEKTVKNLLRATRTPEVFILKPAQDQFSVVYKGAIDDNPQSAGDVGHAYLTDALFNLLNNSEVKLNQTRPIGCLIK